MSALISSMPQQYFKAHAVVVIQFLTFFSEYSDPILLSTNGAPPLLPDPPQLIEAKPHGFRLAWQKRAEDDHFELQMEDPESGYGFINICTGRELCWEVRNLERNKEYRFRVSFSSVVFY